MHPSCFGETAETIRGYEESGRSYYCYFCRPDKDCCKLQPHLVVDQAKVAHLFTDLKSRNEEPAKRQKVDDNPELTSI